MNVENRNAYLKLLANGSPTQPFSIHTMKPNEPNPEYAAQLIEYSGLMHGTPRSIVEADIEARYKKV